MNQKFDMYKPMFWSSEVEMDQIELKSLSFQNIGSYSLPIPNTIISGLINKVRSGKFRNNQKCAESATIVLDAALVSMGKRSRQNQFNNALHGLAYKALQNATNMESDWIPVHSIKLSFKKAIVCLPGGDYKSINNFVAVESGFAGTLLLQLPIKNGYKDASLQIFNQCGVVAQFDLAKNSCVNPYLTLLMNQSSASLLHYEITPPSSGAVIALVYHLVWLDSSKLSPRYSTLSSFLSLTTQLTLSIENATASAASLPDIFYLRLPGFSTREELDSKLQKGEASDMLIALALLKQYETVRVVVGAKTSNSIAVIQMESNGNSKIFPQEWAGSTLQVIHIPTEESSEAIAEVGEELGVLIASRKRSVIKCCSENFLCAIHIVQERFQMSKESESERDRMLNELRNIAQYAIDQRQCPKDKSEIDDFSALLDLLLRSNLYDVCVAVLKCIQAKLLVMLQNKTSVKSDIISFTPAIQLLFTFCSRISRSDIYVPIQQLVGCSQKIDLYQLILDTMHSYTLTLNKEKYSYTVQEIHGMVDSLSTIASRQNGSRSLAKLTEIGEFFVQFNPKALATVLIKFEIKHLSIKNSYYDVYEELFQRVAQLEYDLYHEDEVFLDEVARHYSKSRDIASFARVFVRTTYANPISVARFNLFFSFLMSRVGRWSKMKTFYDAIESTPRGSLLLQSIFEKYVNNPNNRPTGNTRSKKKKTKTKILSPSFGSLIRFFVLALHCRNESEARPAITQQCRDIINIMPDQNFQELFLSLLTWDIGKLKHNDYALGIVTEFVYALIVHFPDKSMDMCNSTVYLKIGDCLARKGDTVLSEAVVAEIISKLNDKKQESIQTNNGFHGKILEGIFQSSLVFGIRILQKPLIKVNLIDKMLELWITLIAKSRNCSWKFSPSWTKNIISCASTFFRARKLNLNTPNTLNRVQDLHEMVNTLRLDNLIILFKKVLKIEVGPVCSFLKAVDSVSWSFYVEMCSRAIAIPHLGAYLKTCELGKAGLLYGFTLWIGIKHLVDRLNEEIISLPPTDSGICLSEALPGWPTVKRLAVDACSKQALRQLTEKRQDGLLKNHADEETLEKRKLAEEPLPGPENNRVLIEQTIKSEAPDAEVSEEPLIKKIKIEPAF